MLLEPARRTAGAAPRASPSGARRRRRRGSAGAGSGTRRRRRSSARSGRTSSLRTSAAARVSSLRSSGASACHRAAVEHPALDRPALEHHALARVELVEPRREQRLDRRRHRRPRRPGVADERDHLLDEERVALGRLEDPVAQVVVDARRAPRAAAPVSAASSGSSSTVVAFTLPPPHPGRRSSSSGRAMQSSRIGASRDRSATCSTRSRNVSSPQCRSSKHDDERPLLRAPPRAACGPPTRSPRATWQLLVSPSSERSGRAASPSSAVRRAASATSTTGQYVIPSPYERQRPRTTRRLDRREELGRQAGLADARDAEHREELAGRGRAATARRRRAAAAARARARPSALERGARASRRHREQPERRPPARPCPSARAARPARPRPPPRTSASVSAPISTSPGGAACSSRAATFTASPVASRSSVPVTTSPC